jgi:hypothetical protein
MKLYQRDYVSINHGIDPMHGMRLNVGASYNNYYELDNHTNWSITYPSKDYAENIPPNKQLTPDHLRDQKDMHISATLEYTPRMRYRMWKGKKYMRGSRYPTFQLGYQRGLKDVANSDSDYELIYASIWQNKEWGIFNAFKWQAGGGYFTRNQQMHFSRFQHFNTNEIPLSFKEWHNTFNLLDDYSVSTNKWYAQAHVSYTTPYLLLKFLPWVSNRLWLENVYASYLTQPNLRNYAEFGYGISQIFFMGSIGAFVGFENGQYRSWGIKISLNID